MAKLREIDLLAVLTALLCVLLTWASRHTLNPDGVSYLDMAETFRRGDWSHFVQGYWSPLYPVLLSLIATFTGLTGQAAIPAIHLINACCALGTIGIIWHWGRRPDTHPFFGRAALAAFLIVSAGPPRVEAVTPDVLLLFLATWITYEMVIHRGRRWLHLGLLLGAAFLAKTSAWPWLVVTLGARLVLADTAARRDTLRATAACLAVMLLWVVPLSRKEGRVTLSSAGRLNFCWYLRGCDSRSPDTHSGTHRSYRLVQINDSTRIGAALFDDNAPWTYEPWSDPTHWERGVLTRHSIVPTVFELLRYWFTLARNVFALWLLPLFVLVLAPLAWVFRRPGMWRSLRHADRDVGVVMGLGLVGVLEFVAVHVEPRLIAPFALMFALAMLAWLCRPAVADTTVLPAPAKRGKKAATAPAPTATAPTRWLRHALTLIGLVGAASFTVSRIKMGIDTDNRITVGSRQLAAASARMAQNGVQQNRIAIFGPVFPVLAQIYWLGARVVGQVPPGAAELIQQLPEERQRQIFSDLFLGKADVIWFTRPNGSFRIFVPARP